MPMMLPVPTAMSVRMPIATRSFNPRQMCIHRRIDHRGTVMLLPAISDRFSTSLIRRTDFPSTRHRRPDVGIRTKAPKTSKDDSAICSAAPFTPIITDVEFLETRRSAKYDASNWDDDFVQSLTSPYTAEEYMELAENLKREVKVMIDDAENLLERLEVVDNLQRLDISYHFHQQVHKLLEDIYRAVVCYQGRNSTELDLHGTALQFRLLRQHGYHVPQEVFCSFMDEAGNFKMCLASDVKGIMSLYEASFLSMEGETILDSAKNFASHHLNQRLEQTADASLADEIRHALELPLHWRVQKLEARWFMDVYQARRDAISILLELAKLNFNMVQAKYQGEIKHLSRWYKETRLSEKLGFARHRLAEAFFWALGITPEPHLAYSRMLLCKVAVLLMKIDDVYDLYGTAEELEMFTNTIQRWDTNELASLPDYMRIIFLAIFNLTNEMAYDILRDQGFNIIPHLSKSWAELSRAFNVEARWYRNGHFPGVNEYLNTAWISSTGPLVLLCAYLSIADPINKNEVESIEKCSGIVQGPSMIFRLTNDLATAKAEMERGDVPSSVQCYMRETGSSEEDARDYIRQLIDVTLRRMNKERVMEKGMGMNDSFCTSAMNFARVVQCMYQFGDGIGVPHRETKQNLVKVIVEPIPVNTWTI